MAESMIYKFYVWPIGGEMKFFRQDQEDEAYEYACLHEAGVKLI